MCKQCTLGNHEDCTGRVYQADDSPECTCGCAWAPVARQIAAKEKLDAAIKEYYRAVEPDSYVNGWTLVTHKQTIETAQTNQSIVGRLTPTEQYWPLTVGMLRIALKAEESF